MAEAHEKNARIGKSYNPTDRFDLFFFPGTERMREKLLAGPCSWPGFLPGMVDALGKILREVPQMSGRIVSLACIESMSEDRRVRSSEMVGPNRPKCSLLLV